MKFSVQPVLLALESPMVTVHTHKGYLESQNETVH